MFAEVDVPREMLIPVEAPKSPQIGAVAVTLTVVMLIVYICLDAISWPNQFQLLYKNISSLKPANKVNVDVPKDPPHSIRDTEL